MIEGAERSIDVQYFLIKPDTSAVLIVESLIDVNPGPKSANAPAGSWPISWVWQVPWRVCSPHS
jgi:hypothetical protein